MRPLQSSTYDLKHAKRCLVQVQGEEFWARVSKREVRRLKDHLGG